MFNANSVDPDQTLCSVASDLGLHCLPMSVLWDIHLEFCFSAHQVPSEKGFVVKGKNLSPWEQISF